MIDEIARDGDNLGFTHTEVNPGIQENFVVAIII